MLCPDYIKEVSIQQNSFTKAQSLGFDKYPASFYVHYQDQIKKFQ